MIALPGSTERTAARALGVAASFDDPLFVGEQSLIDPFLRSIADWPVSFKMLTRRSLAEAHLAPLCLKLMFVAQKVQCALSTWA